MLINSLKIENYKRVANKSLEFEQGLNVVVGNNEAGKSTISSAILCGLFLNSATKTKDVKAGRTWNSDRLGSLELDITFDNAEYSVIKDFENGILKLVDSKGKVLLEDQKKLNQLFKDKTGIGSSGMYINTAHIAQNDVSLIKSDADLLDAVQSLAAESNENISLKQIIKDVESKIRDIEKGRGKLTVNKGILAKLEADLERIEVEISNNKTNRDLMAGNQSELSKVEQRLKMLEPELKSIQDLVKINEEIIKSKDDNKIYNAELDAIEKKLERLKALEVDESLGIDINKANKDMTFLHEGKNGILMSLKLPLLIVGLILSFIALINSDLRFMFLFGMPLIISSLVLIFQEKQKKAEALKVLKKWNCANLYEFEQLIIRSAKLQQNMGERNGILMGESEIDLEKKRKELYKKINMLELKYLTPQMLKLELSSKEYYDKLNQIETDHRELEKLKAKRIELRTLLGNSSGEPSNVEDLLQEKSMIESEIKYWEEKCEVLKIVLEGMQYSLTKTAENFKNKSSEFISKTLSRLTSGRYNKVRIGKDLSVQVYSDEKQDWVEDIKELSKGTVDQIFFVIRLAFFIMLHKDEYMPLILDDPFTGYDEMRLKAVKDLLLDLSKDIQILLFTHNPIYRDWGNTIELA